ncbi:MAG TPA: N-acetylmuramoyl-L-alanine amidase [Xanthobacteraceae bacterium]|jgi:N-acetylmuramoyl-L-alanine amidase
MQIAISSGHGKYIRGASASPRPPYLDEVDEARRVVAKVAEFWREAGVTVRGPFNDDTSTTQNQNLNTIVNWHNAQARDYDVSVHFNAYQKTTKAMGTECLYVTQQTLASNVAAGIARAGSLINRGPKKRTDLFFLNNTAMPAVLLEVCFVDSEADGNLYRQHFDAICKSIAEVIGQVTIGEPEAPPTEPPPEPVEPPPDAVTARVDITIKTEGNVVVSINGQDFMISEPGPEEPTVPLFPPNQSDIKCSVFGGSSDPNDSAYAPYDTITDQEISCALPWKFKEPRRKVLVHNDANGRDATCTIRDIGPWLTDDDYWITGERPLAETCYINQTPLPRGPNKGKIPNGAGIDITPAAARAIGLSGMGQVSWYFVTEEPAIV